MTLSRRFRDVRSRIRELRTHLLPSTFSPTGDYSDRQMDRARGFRLLVHAEFESYLEDISRDTVTEAIRRWKGEGISSRPLISFLASYHSSWSVSDTISNEEIMQIAKSRKNIRESVEKIIDLAQTQFIQRIQNNHGIIEDNFYGLIVPTGVDISKLDQTWIASLSSFGASRGKVAHQSKMVVGAINPEDELKTVNDLIKGIEALDKCILLVRKK